MDFPFSVKMVLILGLAISEGSCPILGNCPIGIIATGVAVTGVVF